MTSTTHRPAITRAGLTMLVLVLTAACGQASPSPSPAPFAASLTLGPCTPEAATASPSAVPPTEPPSPDSNDPNAARYEEIERQVTDLRGLAPTADVRRDVLDRVELGEFIQESFTSTNPEALVANSERLLKALLLMPQDGSLRDLYVEMLTSQALGLYDDTTKRMYVISDSGEIGPLEEITYAHEYTHALQDQAFVIGDVRGTATDQGDRALARTALIEGDATLLMTLWAQQNLTPDQLLSVAGAVDPGSQAALDSLPAILRESLTFPYTQGLNLALGEYIGGVGFPGVDALYANPPDSTEQVMHPTKLDPREAPIEVVFDRGAAGSDWCAAFEDTLGEFQLGILLNDAVGVEKSAAGTAAAGWGGDRVALVDGPDGVSGVVLDTRWDTPEDATEFATALGGMVAKQQAAGRAARVLTPAPDRVVLLTASGDTPLAQLEQSLGLAR
jgi:hypothetical protein